MTGERTNGATPPETPAIVAEGLSKTYKIGRPTPTSPKFVQALGRTAKRVLPGLRDDSRRGLAKDFADPGPLKLIPALRDLNFEIPRGAAIGIAGPVGSGKSTLLKVLTRVSPPTEGKVTIHGRVAPALDLAPSFLQGDLTGRENCYKLARLFGVPRGVVDRRVDDIFTFAELSSKIDTNAKTYSTSEYRRLGFSIALNLESDILVADERVLGGDTAFAEHVRWRIASASAEEGLTLLLESNDPAVLQEFCHEVFWMEEGRIAERFPAQGVEEEVERLRYRSRDQGGSVDAEALDPARKALLNMLLTHDKSYEEISHVLGRSEEEVRELSHAAVRAVAPPSVVISTERRVVLIDYILGQLAPDDAAETRRSLGKSPPDHQWAQAAVDCLSSAGFDSSAELPKETAAKTVAPTPGPAAMALLKFVRARDGHDEADAALDQATEIAVRKRQDTIKWFQIANAVGLDHEEAKGIVTRMMEAEEREIAAGANKRKIFNEHIAIMGAELLTEDGDAAETIRVDEPVAIRVRLEAASPELHVGLSVNMTSRDAEDIRIAHSEQFKIPRPGSYEVTAEVPGSTFEDARYEGRIVVRTKHGKSKGSVQAPGAFELLVYDPRDPDEQEEDLDAEGVAAFPPDVEWSVRRVGGGS